LIGFEPKTFKAFTTEITEKEYLTGMDRIFRIEAKGQKSA